MTTIMYTYRQRLLSVDQFEAVLALGHLHREFI